MRATSDPLREAAALMRERVRQTTVPGPWAVEPDEGGVTDVIGPWLRHECGGYGTPIVITADDRDAAHIASWHPAVALAVADWLDGVADRVENTSPARLRFDIEEREVILPALAVAHAYLGLHDWREEDMGS